MGTTLSSKIKWSFWQVVFSLTVLSIVYAANTNRMILWGLITCNSAGVNVVGLEHPPNYLKDFWSDLLWVGSPQLTLETSNKVDYDLFMSH